MKLIYNVDSNVGMMQGRLSDSPDGILDWFPENCWEAEFNTASKLGYGYIELIAEKKHNPDNPIWTGSGMDMMRQVANATQSKLSFLCNNYIIENAILKEDALVQLERIFRNCHLLGIQHVILPFLEASEIKLKEMKVYSAVLKRHADFAWELGINIHIETNLHGNDLLEFVSLVNAENVFILIDTGNYNLYQFDIFRDIDLFGNLIGHVHIKDRDTNGNNVLMGTGNVDFLKILTALHNISYRGKFTFETNRGLNAVNTAKHNISFFDFLYHEASSLSAK